MCIIDLLSYSLMAESDELLDERACGQQTFNLFDASRRNTDGTTDAPEVQSMALMRSYFDQQFKILKRDLKEDVFISSCSTLKKFKDTSSGKDLKFNGNQKQFAFNLEIIEGVDEFSDLESRLGRWKSLTR